MIIEDKKLYRVGGVVRDEILGIDSVDVDYCYEGNAIDFAVNSGLKVVKINPDFGTVRVIFGNKELDIASTRTEYYPKKGHLPAIKSIGCPIEDDLIRRDFSVNAIAERTSDGEIIDIFDGQKDIKNKTLRVLQKKSFIDDPTRIIRGLKFAIRFGFELDDETKKLQNNYLSDVNYDMSYYRLKNELKDAFSINKSEVYNRFIEQRMYKLFCEKEPVNLKNGNNIENFISKNPSDISWLAYLSGFDLSKFSLTKKEKNFLKELEKINLC